MKKNTDQRRGLKVNRHFTQEGISPLDMFSYEKRSSVIRNPAGDAVLR